MSKTEEELRACESCGATIYPEHIAKGHAEYWGGKLLCPHCLQEKRTIAAVNPAAAYAEDDTDEQEPIVLSLDEDSSDAARRPTEIRAFGGGPAGGIATEPGGGTAFGVALTDAKYQRPLLPDSLQATRCRTFHSKLNDASMAHMNDTINEWADGNPEIRIKFATSCVGVFEGKSSSDPHMIVTVFY